MSPECINFYIKRSRKMSEMCGWMGKLLRVDLGTGEITTEDTSKYVPEYIGGKGIATRIAWNELMPDVGPYDPENMLLFMSGPFTGTLAPTSGRGSGCGISPRTGLPMELWAETGRLN
jgi:aldehyde:ferredoxin oxidoreductase